MQIDRRVECAQWLCRMQTSASSHLCGCSPERCAGDAVVQIRRWMREAGMLTWQDAVGNVHGRVDGTELRNSSVETHVCDAVVCPPAV